MSAKSWLSGPSRKAAVIRHLPGTLVAVDRSATILWASESTETMFGFADDELIGRNGLDLIDPLDAGTAATALLRTMDSDGVKEPWPLRIIDAEGESRWVEMLPSNLLDEPGVGAVLIAIRPIDEQDAVAQEARTIEELFRRAFDDAPIGAALVRVDGRFARVNRALCELLGRPIIEVVGAMGTELTHPDDLDAERPLVVALLAGEQQSYQLEKRFLRPDGSPVPTSVHVSLVRTDAGAPERFVVHVQDLGDRVTEAASARSRFDDRIEVALERTKRVPTSVGLVLCPVVDDDGRHRVEAAVRPGDVVAVVGPGEVVVLCEDLVTATDLEAIADRVRRAVGGPVRSVLWSGLESPDELLALARLPW